MCQLHQGALNLLKHSLEASIYYVTMYLMHPVGLLILVLDSIPRASG